MATYTKEQTLFVNRLSVAQLLVLLHDIYYKNHVETNNEATMLNWRLYNEARQLSLTWDNGVKIANIIRERL